MLRVISLSIFVVTLMSSNSLSGQAQDPETGFFLVEEEKFSPPEKAIVDHYQGSKAMAFMAKDMNNVDQYLGDYRGKTTLLWFWKSSEPECLRLLDPMNQLSDRCSIISFAHDSRQEMKEFMVGLQISFPVIPNAHMFGEGAYAGDLGYPRAFLVNGSGVITKVLPASFFSRLEDPYSVLKSLIEEIN